jgi:hydrogenase maturation protease
VSRDPRLIPQIDAPELGAGGVLVPGEPGRPEAGRVGGSDPVGDADRVRTAGGELGAGGVLVVGYGNALRSDDGVGVHAAGLLARDPRLAWAEVVALHQLAPELALSLSEVSLAVFVDAATDVAPGEIAVRWVAKPTGGPRAEPSPPDPVAEPGPSSHHVGVEELVALARELYGAAPETVTVRVGVADLELGEALSPLVAGALPSVVDTVAELVAAHRRA